MSELWNLIHAVPHFVAWRIWKWHRDYHETRHMGGEISQELVNAQTEEYEARKRLNRVLNGEPKP
jgi:hypothetical protein